MDKDIAWQVIRASFRCSADLQILLKFLKERCSAEDYKPFALGIATAIDTINVQLMDRAVAIHPDLAKKIEADLDKYGQIT